MRPIGRKGDGMKKADKLPREKLAAVRWERDQAVKRLDKMAGLLRENMADGCRCAWCQRAGAVLKEMGL
jgi:hypothetical protein